MAFSLLIANSLLAQDEPRTSDKSGCNDYALLSRYKGAVIQECQTINYAKFYFGLEEPVRKNFGGHGQFFNKYIEVSGKLNNTQYLIPLDDGVLKVFENYKNALTNAGFNILYTENNKNSCFYREDFFGGDNPFSKFSGGFYSCDCEVDYYYVVAKGIRDTLDVYLSLYISTGGNYGQDFVVVNQSVVETVPLELGLVSAQNIAQNIDNAGHSIFYDIHFASGSAEIDAKSTNQLQEIAKYLNSHKDKSFYIVGHTDNTGNFDDNMTLSNNRAKAVVNELNSKYNVDANQLTPYGVANLCPVTNNNTDAGKARNRRVEIVEK